MQLFTRYPLLVQSIPYINLGTFPTPIYTCDNLPLDGHNTNLYIKDDGVCGKTLLDGTQLFGGNKVRKLEFALADALKQGATTVMTFGCVGSNHALAVTTYAKFLGLKSVCLLSDQPNSTVVQRNLLLQQLYNAELHFFPTGNQRKQGAYHQFFSCHNNTNSFPYVIPTGASYPLGVIGFVNAAFELLEQINEGIIPTPDYLYVAAGSLGTLSGLILGCRAANIQTKIIGVAVEPDIKEVYIQKTLELIKATNKYLHTCDPSFPLFKWNEHDVTITIDFSGPDYGVFTAEAQEAIGVLQKRENITLDGVYAGKAFAALLNHCEHGFLDNKTVLFWNTFCAERFEELIKTVDYKTLDVAFHRYFENDNNHSKRKIKYRQALKTFYWRVF